MIKVSDDLVLETQKWLNQTYGNVSGFGSVPEDGKTGWDTIYGLIRALQHELGIQTLVNNFGPTTQADWNAQFKDKVKIGFKHNVISIIQGGFWCKGINPGTFDGLFSQDTASAVQSLKSDANLVDQTAVVDAYILGALLDMSAFVLVPGGDAKIRQMQRTLNHDYQSYTGILPCDGIYQRDTNTALIYALQATEGMTPEQANGVYGPGTTLETPTLKVGTNNAFVRIIRWGLYVNGFSGALDADGNASQTFDNDLGTVINQFRQFIALPATTVPIADLDVFKGLLISSGNPDRDTIACDTSYQLTSDQVNLLVEQEFSIVGRYLTGTVGVAEEARDKFLTTDEISTIVGAGMSLFPIYQDGASDQETYFTHAQGLIDAQKAIDALYQLGFPYGTVVYFAVDCDFQTGDIPGTVLPYFAAIQSLMINSDYETGVYGTRNVAASVINDGTASKAFVSDMSTGYSGNLGFPMPQEWAFDQIVEVSISNFAIDKVNTNALRSTAVKDFSSDNQKISQATIDFVNHNMQDYGDDFPLFNSLKKISFSKTVLKQEIDGGAVDIIAELKLGGSGSVPGEGVELEYEVSEGKLTTDMAPFYNLLKPFSILTPDTAQDAVEAVCKKMSNGHVWVEPNLLKTGFSLHIYNESTRDEKKALLTISSELILTVSFHKIDVDDPSLGTLNYNEKVETIQTGNWLLSLPAIASHAFSGNEQTGILTDDAEEVNPLIEGLGSLFSEFESIFPI